MGSSPTSTCNVITILNAPAWVSDATWTDCILVPADFWELSPIAAVSCLLLFHLWICDSDCIDLLAFSPIHG